MNKLYPLSLPQLAIKLLSSIISLLSPILAEGKTVNRGLSVLSPLLGMAHSCHCHGPKGVHPLNKKQCGHILRHLKKVQMLISFMVIVLLPFDNSKHLGVFDVFSSPLQNQ